MSLAREVLARIREHNVPIFAASIAFFSFLALVPTLVAAISIYGLVGDPEVIVDQVTDLTSSLPESTSAFLTDQMDRIARSSSGEVGVALAVSLLIALASASGAVANMMKVLNVVYGVEETRGLVRLRLTAVGLLVGAIVVFSAAIIALTTLPAIVASTGLGRPARVAISLARFPVLALLMMVGLTILYTYGPDRPRRRAPLSLVPPSRFRFLALGPLMATLGWLFVSLGFSIYAQNFSSYAETYGIFAGIVMLLVWFQLTALIVIIGAEIDSARHP